MVELALQEQYHLGYRIGIEVGIENCVCAKGSLAREIIEVVISNDEAETRYEDKFDNDKGSYHRQYGHFAEGHLRDI